MDDIELKIVDGPAKPDLQWAVAYPERHLHVHFDTAQEGVDVHLDEMNELGDGTQFALKGHLTSPLQGLDVQGGLRHRDALGRAQGARPCPALARVMARLDNLLGGAG